MSRKILKEESRLRQLKLRAGEKFFSFLISLTKIISIFLAGVIFGAFLVDLLVVSEKRTPRLSSRSFAQLLFLGFIILMALFSQQGAIL